MGYCGVTSGVIGLPAGGAFTLEVPGLRLGMGIYFCGSVTAEVEGWEDKESWSTADTWLFCNAVASWVVFFIIFPLVLGRLNLDNAILSSEEESAVMSGAGLSTGADFGGATTLEDAGWGPGAFGGTTFIGEGILF